MGHHVQTLLGISSQVQQARSQVSQKEGNQLSVRQELQADCLAGIWANHNQQRTQFLEAGDVEEAMDAAQKLVMTIYKNVQQVKLCLIVLPMAPVSKGCIGFKWA